MIIICGVVLCIHGNSKRRLQSNAKNLPGLLAEISELMKVPEGFKVHAWDQFFSEWIEVHSWDGLPDDPLKLQILPQENETESLPVPLDTPKAPKQKRMSV